MTRSWLSSSDAPTSLKITGLKMGMVVVATALDDFSSVQPPLVALLVLSVCFYQVVEVGCLLVHEVVHTFGTALTAITTTTATAITTASSEAHRAGHIPQTLHAEWAPYCDAVCASSCGAAAALL